MASLRAFGDYPTRIGILSLARAASGAVGVRGDLAPNALFRGVCSAAGCGSTSPTWAAQLPAVLQQPRVSTVGWQAPALLQQAHMTTIGRSRRRSNSASDPEAEPLADKAYTPPAAAAVEAAASGALPSHTKDQRSIDDMVEEVLHCAAAKSHAQHESPLQALAECVVGRAQELSSKQIRDLTVAFSKLHFFDTAFRGAMARAMKERLHEFEPAHLADTAMAFADAGYYDYELFMKVLVPHLHGHASRYDAASLAKILSAFTRFGLNDEVLVELMQEVTIKLGSKEGSKAIAEVVFAEARMGWADERVQNLAAYYAAEHIQDFDAETVSKLVYGLIVLGYDDDALLALLMNRAKEVASDLGPEDVSRMMWAAGELGYYDEPFLNTMADLVAATPEAYTGAQLDLIVTACNKLSYSSPSVATAAYHLGQAHGMPTFAL